MTRSLFRKLNLRPRFLIGVGMMLLPLLALATATLISLSALEGAFEEVVHEALEEKAPVESLLLDVGGVLDAAHRHLDHGRPQDRERLLKLSVEIEEAFARVDPLSFAQDEERILLAMAGEEWQRLHPLLAEIAARDAGAKSDLERLENGADLITTALRDISRIADDEIVGEIEEVQRLQSRTLGATAAIFLVGIVFALAIGRMLARSVVAPVEALEEGARQFAAGNLGHRVAVEGSDELAALTGAFNAMADEVEKSQDALRELSIRDPLTGLFNHREIFRVLDDEVERGRRYAHPISFLMLDLDFFKKINDSYGHPAGDRVLKDLAAVISRQLRQTDLVGRYGGEEFAVILPETSGAEAYELARRIHREIGGHGMPLGGGGDVSVTVSIGLASFPLDAVTAEKLVAAADAALYEAKNSGRNRVCRAGLS